MDLARNEPEYLDELVNHHVGGHLKVAPEHVSDGVLAKMKKPPQATFEEFTDRFRAASKRAGKDQYLVPYFISGHPGSGLEEMIELAVFLKKNGHRPRQVQDFIPAPMDIATCMYYTGLDPVTMREVPVARAVLDRRVQRALMQFFKPENYFEVKKALLSAGRKDLIGEHRDALIPSTPPREALEARRERAAKFDRVAQSQARLDGEFDDGYVHDPTSPSNPSAGGGPAARTTRPADAGYRPGRKSAQKRGGGRGRGRH
jgi:hypothetical protein